MTLRTLWQIEDMHTDSNSHLLASMHSYYDLFTLLPGSLLHNADHRLYVMQKGTRLLHNLAISVSPKELLPVPRPIPTT